MKKYLYSILCLVIAIVVDQYSKILAITHLQKKSIVIWEGVFQLHYLENQGAAFGILQNKQWFFLIIGIVITVLIAYVYIRMPQDKKFHLLRICLLFIAAGAIGNMIDRIRYRYVVDFLYFELINFPIFNVADIYVTIATIGLAVIILFYYTDEDFGRLAKCVLPKRKSSSDKEIQG